MKRKKLTIQQRQETRDYLYQKLEAGDLEIAETVKLIRTIFNMSQVEFAKKLGVSKFTITNLESGGGNPTLGIVNKILSLMGMTLKVGLKNRT